MSARKKKTPARETPLKWHLGTTKFPLHFLLENGFLVGDEVFVGRLDKDIFVVGKLTKGNEWIFRKMNKKELSLAVTIHKKSPAVWRQNRASSALLKPQE